MLLISYADGLIASGTGPLHLAAALGIHCLGLYPNKQRINGARWAPLGAKAQHIATKQACQQCVGDICPCMNAISVAEVKQAICKWLK